MNSRVKVLNVCSFVCFFMLALSINGYSANIVDNSDFSNDLTDWTSSYGGQGDFTIEVLPSYGGYTDVLHYQRTNSNNNGGNIQICQDFSVDPYNCHADRVKISLRFMIASHSLTNSGWWSESYGGFGEYPLHLYLGTLSGKFNTSGQVWNLGLLCNNNSSDYLENYMAFPQNTWISGSGTMPIDGYHLTTLTIIGEGWDFDVYVDYIEVEPINSKSSSAGDDPGLGVGFVFETTEAEQLSPYLSFLGSVDPGESIDVRVTGKPYSTVWLSGGSGVRALPLSTCYGRLYLIPPFQSRSCGVIPEKGILVAPMTVPNCWVSGQEYPFQALVGRKLSNLVVLIAR